MTSYLPLLLILLTGCTGERDIRDYYYPVRELTDGLVYQYENTGNLNDAPYEYWYFLGLDRDTVLYLSTTLYADGLTPVQVATERIRNEGAYLEQLSIHPHGADGIRRAVQAEVLYDRVFPFHPGDGLASGYRVSFSSPANPDAVNYVSLNRFFRGDTVISVLGKMHDAVVFDLQGEVSERDAKLGDISPTFSGYEIYAEGLGLVEYRRDLGLGGVAGAKLVGRVGMEEYTGSLGE